MRELRAYTNSTKNVLFFDKLISVIARKGIPFLLASGITVTAAIGMISLIKNGVNNIFDNKPLLSPPLKDSDPKTPSTATAVNPTQQPVSPEFSANSGWAECGSPDVVCRYSKGNLQFEKTFKDPHTPQLSVKIIKEADGYAIVDFNPAKTEVDIATVCGHDPLSQWISRELSGWPFSESVMFTENNFQITACFKAINEPTTVTINGKKVSIKPNGSNQAIFRLYTNEDGKISILLGDHLKPENLIPVEKLSSALASQVKILTGKKINVPIDYGSISIPNIVLDKIPIPTPTPTLTPTLTPTPTPTKTPSPTTEPIPTPEPVKKQSQPEVTLPPREDIKNISVTVKINPDKDKLFVGDGQNETLNRLVDSCGSPFTTEKFDLSRMEEINKNSWWYPFTKLFQKNIIPPNMVESKMSHLEFESACRIKIEPGGKVQISGRLKDGKIAFAFTKIKTILDSLKINVSDHNGNQDIFGQIITNLVERIKLSDSLWHDDKIAQVTVMPQQSITSDLLKLNDHQLASAAQEESQEFVDGFIIDENGQFLPVNNIKTGTKLVVKEIIINDEGGCWFVGTIPYSSGQKQIMVNCSNIVIPNPPAFLKQKAPSTPTPDQAVENYGVLRINLPTDMQTDNERLAKLRRGNKRSNTHSVYRRS